MNFSQRELEQILEQHKRWIYDSNDGSRADLSNANLVGANLHGAKLVGADLSGANLSSSDLRGADLRGADLSGAHLKCAHFALTNLRKANLCNADLSQAYVHNSDLIGANLRDSKLIRSDIFRTDLNGVDLSGTDFSEAYIYEARFSGATMDGCILPNGEKFEEWLPTIQEWLDIPGIRVYEWPDGSRISVKFVQSYPKVALEFELSGGELTEEEKGRFFLDDQKRLSPSSGAISKALKVFFDLGLIKVSSSEEGTWICPTSEEIELRRLLDEPHPLLLPFDELKAWMLSVLPSK